MKFETAVLAIPTVHNLKRTASAHVVDYTRLDGDALRENIIRTQKQYTHPEEVESALKQCLWLDTDLNHRVLAEIIIMETLLNAFSHLVTYAELEEKVEQFEQAVVNESNEKRLKDIAGTKEDSEKFKSISLYNFVLETAWEHCDDKSVDESNLLRRIRERLRITPREHRLLEAMLGKYPKKHNELHTRGEINDAVKALEQAGLVLCIRDDNGEDFVVIPEEIAKEVKRILKVEIRQVGYEQLLQAKYVKRKDFLQSTLDKYNVPYAPAETVDELRARIIECIRPTILLGGTSPKDGLNNDVLYQWCSDLDLPVAGSKSERIDRIIEHYNQLEVRVAEEGDQREIWYHYYDAFANRDFQQLRAQHLIEKDNEIEKKFEEATDYLFEFKLNHSPLRQAGTEHSDGLLSFRDTYIMWDNKSKECPVNLKEHIRQFDRYMDKSEKPVPVFLVIGPDFTPESEGIAMEYTAENIGRNIALIKANDLKELAELWASADNKRNSEPFPLGLLARPGIFNLNTIRGSLK